MFTASFEMILFACQQEKLYQLYLNLLAIAWECWETEQENNFSAAEYESGFCIKPDFVSLGIHQKSPKEQVWGMVVSIKLEQPTGTILVQSPLQKVITGFMKEVEGKVEQSMFLTISQKQQNLVL